METSKIISTFEDGLGKAQDVLLAALLKEIGKLTSKDGVLQNNRQGRELIKQITEMVNKALSKSGFEKMVSELIESFDDIDKNIAAAHLETNGLIVDKALFTPQKALFVEMLTNSMTAGGIRKEFVLPMEQTIFSYIRNRRPVSELEKIVREGSSTDLKRWAGTTARDAVYGYQGAANDAIKAAYGMNGYIYTGGERENTRAQCSKWIREGKQADAFWEEEIRWAKKGGTYKGRKVSGFKKDTVLSNFAQNRGGHGCLHEALPVFVE